MNRSVMIYFAFFIITPVLITKPIYGQSTAEMLSACRPIVEAQINQGSLSVPQTFEAGMCWGAFKSIQGALVLYDSKLKTPLLHVCLPFESNTYQLVAIFFKYAQDHPEFLHQNYFITALNSLTTSFSCDQNK